MNDRDTYAQTPRPNFWAALMFCGLEAHKWFEWKTDFFEPRNVYEQCRWCGKKRVRWDKRKYRRVM